MPRTMITTIIAIALSGCAHLSTAGDFADLIYQQCGSLPKQAQRACIEDVVARAAECAVEQGPDTGAPVGDGGAD